MQDDDQIRDVVIEEARDDVVSDFDGEYPIEIDGLRNSFGEQVIHEDLSLQVRRGLSPDDAVVAKPWPEAREGLAVRVGGKP